MTEDRSLQANPGGQGEQRMVSDLSCSMSWATVTPSTLLRARLVPKVWRRTCADSAGRPSSSAPNHRRASSGRGDRRGRSGQDRHHGCGPSHLPGGRTASGWGQPHHRSRHPSSTVAAWLVRIDSSHNPSGINVLVIDEAATVDDRALARLAEVTQLSDTKPVGIADPHR